VAENFVDFRTIKENVSMQAALDHYRIELRKVNQNSLRGKCPLPTHSSEKSQESFGVHTGKNIWACQSSSCAAARQGKKGGNVLDFVATMENCSVRDAAVKLREWFGTANQNARDETSQHVIGEKKKLVAEKKEGSDDRKINAALSFALKDVDAAHPYLRQRGIKEETARHFGVGFFSGRGSMSGRVVIPIHNDRGELIAYAGRSIDASEPKYKLPAGFHKSIELFHLHRALATGREHVIIVEGFFDCMKVHQAGFPNVVALMGSTLSEEQHKLLTPFLAATLFLDGDEAGREATKTIAARMAHSHFVKIISLPDGKQPDQLSSEEIKIIFGSR
jgi:DNA primase